MELQTRSSERYGAGAAQNTYRSSGPVLVVTDGTSASDAAFMIAHLIAGQNGAGVQVLSVVEPLPDPFGGYGPLSLTAELDTERQREMRSRVEQQCARC